MRPPVLPRFTRTELIFSLKCFAAALIAMTLASRAGLPRPFCSLMTTYIVVNPASRTVSCRPDALTDEIEQTVNADRSSLRYDAATDRYIYVWKTDSAWAGQCRRLVLRLADDIEHSGLFRFR
jgi:hypothetical protein